ncbi:helix-turn-helix domain-containing protein [Agathobacter sp.]
MGEYSKSAIIKYTRKSLGITQEELSESVCDSVTLARYESGKIDPSDSKFLRLMEKMGEKGSTFIFPLETSLLEVEDEIEKLNKAIEQHDWEEAERIKRNLIQNNNFNLNYPENRQYLQWAETIIQYEQGMINERQVIDKLEKAWSYTCGNINIEEFNMNRIYRETEIMILHEIAIFNKLLGKLDKACVYYENLLKYFERADMVNDTKPIYLIYIGYSNVLGAMGEHEKSMEICFKAIKRGMAENKMNYLYNFYYNIGCSLQINGNDEEKHLAKLYIWIAYQLCQAYPENKRNLEIIKRRYEQI